MYLVPPPLPLKLRDILKKKEKVIESDHSQTECQDPNIVKTSSREKKCTRLRVTYV